MNGLSKDSISRGFTLIEVLIALVVVGIALIGLLQLQASFSGGARDAELRSIAYGVAERQLENLRNFQNYGEFYEIGSGGSSSISNIKYGSVTIPFSINWTVAAFNDSGSVAISSTDATYKTVDITVDWDGSPEPIVLSSIVAKINPDLSAFPGNDSGAGGIGPTVSHAQGAVPDVVPIQISDTLTRETDTPIPEVESRNASTEVRIETVVYDASVNKQIKEDFITVNCICELNVGDNDLLSPYHYRYDSDNESLYVKSGTQGTASYTGTVYTQNGNDAFGQSEYCNRCCSGHHDHDGAYAEFPAFKPAALASVPHPHFEVDVDTGLVTGIEADSDGDVYAESCRFRRVDGVYQLFPDWSLEDLVVLSYSEGATSSALSTYQSYVRAKIQDIVFSSAASPTASAAALSASIGQNISLFPGASAQILARGIYIDDMSYDTEWTTKIGSVNPNDYASGAWLSYVPFNEVNLTLLADWYVSPSGVASVSNEPVESVDPDLNYYGSYSRGLVLADSGAASGAQVTVFAESKTDNMGVLGNRYSKNNLVFANANNQEIPNTPVLVDSLDVDIIGGTGVSVSVIVSEDNTNGNVTIATNKTSVAIVGGTCGAYTVVGGVGSASCNVPANSNATVTVTTTQNNQHITADVGLTVGPLGTSDSTVLSITSGATASISILIGTNADPVELKAYHD